MSRHERRYQKYLDRKRQKHGNKATEAGRLAPQIATAANFPIHEALVPAKLFELGVGHLVFSRLLPDGRIALAAFVLDVFCLGVKDAFVAILRRDEYAIRRSSWSSAEDLQPMQPTCFRKLMEGGVAYAQDLGFSSHADYAVASQIFGDVQATDCPTRFESVGRPPGSAGGWTLALWASGIGVAGGGGKVERGFLRLRGRREAGREAGEIVEAEAAAPDLRAQLMDSLLSGDAGGRRSWHPLGARQ
jgi:hypothetical protein